MATSSSCISFAYILLLLSFPQVSPLNPVATPSLPLAPSVVSSVVDTIQSGRVAIVDDFLKPSFVDALREDAKLLYGQGRFQADGLASYTTTRKFDPEISRQVLRSASWHDPELGSSAVRKSLGRTIFGLRSQLSAALSRPTLLEGTDDYFTSWPDGKKKHEISYTRYSPMASLGRHVDEHNEMLKKKEVRRRSKDYFFATLSPILRRLSRCARRPPQGYSRPTRRSVSWLVYLNSDWSASNGGELRTYPRLAPLRGPCGATHAQDIQVGWLSLSGDEGSEASVFLDAETNGYSNSCSLFTVRDDDERVYLTSNFPADPSLYLAGGTAVRAFFKDKRLASSYTPLEPPHSPADALLNRPALGPGESALDVLPVGGRLVMFDSVALPHEVMACRGKERWAASGWFHEDQQGLEV